MSEITINQEQPEATTTTAPAEQTGGEAGGPSETTSETTPMTIGGGVIVKGEDDTITDEALPVTEVPAGTAPAPEQTASEQTTTTEQATTSTTAAPAEEPAVIVHGMPETKLETEAIAEVKESPPKTSDTNGVEAAPVAGLASIPLLIAAGIKRFRHSKKA